MQTKNKDFFAYLLTCLIPIKKYRKAVRGILLLGVKKYFYIKKSDKTTRFKNTLAIAAIMKNEGPYLKEWLDYHILVGVDKFYLYDNESTDDTVDVLKPYIEQGIVEYTFFPGSVRQIPAYNDCIAKHEKDVRWLAMIDLDEFLVPVQNKTLPEFLKTLPFFGQLIVTWVVYGSSYKQKKEPGLVMERFKRHTDKMWGVKSIVNPRLVVQIKNPHTHDVAGFTIDENGKKLGHLDQTHNPPTCNKIRINHYATKSYEEMIERCSQGDACVANLQSSHKADAQKRFEKRDRNEIYDDIMDKYIDVLKGIKNEL